MGYDMEMEEFHDDEKMKKKQQEELQKALDEIMEEAKNVVDDYTKNPSDMSGSVVQINESSPFMDKAYKGDSWKKVIQGNVDDALDIISKKGLGKKKKK